MIFIKIFKSTTQIRNAKKFIEFDYMIANTLRNKKPNPIVTGLFIRGTKIFFSLIFFTQSYFAVPKIIKLNPTYYCVMKISSM